MDLDAPRRFAIAPLVIFSLIGPLAMSIVVAVLFALLGLFTPVGLGIALYYLLLAFFWLPLLYLLLAPPFFLTGLLVSLFGRFFGEPSFPVAVLAGWIVFLPYFGLSYFLPAATATMRPDAMTLLGWSMWAQLLTGALIVALTTAVCWRLVVAMSSRATQSTPTRQRDNARDLMKP